MRKWIILSFLCSPLFVFSQDYYSKYEELMASGQQDKVSALFDLWEAQAPNDENLYITAFNHYLTFCRERRVIMPIQTDSSDTSSEGYISDEVFFNDSLFNISQAFIQKGINANPRRLDMHFGKIHALWLKGDHRSQTSEILGVIEIGDKIKQDWLWTDNERPENPKELFTSSIYQYVANLYGADKFDYVRQISERMIRSFPKEIANYSNLGATYLIKADYKNALKYFKKAYKLDNKDIIVLNNLGSTYDFMEKYSKAIEYYQLIELYGNDDEKNFAKEKILISTNELLEERAAVMELLQ